LGPGGASVSPRKFREKKIKIFQNFFIFFKALL
jgi:hypothetical protein